VTPFRWKRGRLLADIEAHEAVLLRQVVTEIRDLLSDPESDDTKSVGIVAGSGSADAGAMQDPVTARLLPDGHRSDPDLAEDYRGLTEAGLRAEKRADAALLLQTVGENGGRIELDAAAAEAWLRTINDVRLSIGVRLDINESDDPMVRAEQTGDPRWAVYSWLTAVQGLLVDAVSAKH